MHMLDPFRDDADEDVAALYAREDDDQSPSAWGWVYAGVLLACLTLIAIGASMALHPAHAAERKTCHIAGDSIAFGLHQALPGCTWSARVGAPSAEIIAKVRPADFVVISAGSNDPKNPQLAANLEAARARAGHATVIWILPHLGTAIVLHVAAEHGDHSVAFAAGRDGIHPLSYRALGRAALRLMQ